MLTNSVGIVEKMPALNFMQFNRAIDKLNEEIGTVGPCVSGLRYVLNNDPVILGPLFHHFIPIELNHIAMLPTRLVPLDGIRRFFGVWIISVLTRWHGSMCVCVRRCLLLIQDRIVS